MMLLEAAHYKPSKLTLILAQPRSGSTLLLRLLNMACLTTCAGDRPIGFYEGIVQTWKALQHPGIYGHPIVLEDKGVFPDEWRGESPLRER